MEDATKYIIARYKFHQGSSFYLDSIIIQEQDAGIPADKIKEDLEYIAKIASRYQDAGKALQILDSAIEKYLRKLKGANNCGSLERLEQKDFSSFRRNNNQRLCLNSLKSRIEEYMLSCTNENVEQDFRRYRDNFPYLIKETKESPPQQIPPRKPSVSEIALNEWKQLFKK